MSRTREEIEQLIAATGKYRLEGENTEGANAYAFRAHHVPLDQLVFLKVVEPDPAADVFAEPRLLVEATRTDGADSNVVRVYDAERLGNDYVLVAMEYVNGGSILSRLASGPLPMMEAVSAATGILHGLAQLHQALLVHRDIKPANILLSQRYGRIWPKIADFGSVARLAHPGASVTASRHSALYVPPEGWATPSRYDIRSDLYQAGLVLFEMVNGPLPYPLQDYLDREARRELRELGVAGLAELSDCDACLVVNRALARAASGKGVAYGRQTQPYVPPSLARIIKTATAPDPAARYQTLSQMLGALETVRHPDWRPGAHGDRFVAEGWAGWDWSVEPIAGGNDRRWLVRRSRRGAGKYRLWAEAENERAACRLVVKAAA